MNFIDRFMEKWYRFSEKSRPFFRKVGDVSVQVFDALTRAWNYLLRFRKIFLATPVGVMAVILALRNMMQLPVIVGLDLQANGEFSIQIIREMAVLGPMAITALCLLLFFASKRVLTPWLVSVFSLTLPILIQLTNTFPA